MTGTGPIDSVVLVKQAPDTHHITGDAMTRDGTMNRGVLPAIFNPEDLNALELALHLRERHGGTVTVITMGPPKAAAILREALWRAGTGSSSSPIAEPVAPLAGEPGACADGRRRRLLVFDQDWLNQSNGRPVKIVTTPPARLTCAQLVQVTTPVKWAIQFW